MNFSWRNNILAEEREENHYAFTTLDIMLIVEFAAIRIKISTARITRQRSYLLNCNDAET